MAEEARKPVAPESGPLRDAFLTDIARLEEVQAEFFEHGNLNLWPAQKRWGYMEPPGDVDLDDIGSKEPGSGWGSAVMPLMCALADRHGVSIFLQAHSTFQNDDPSEDSEDYDPDFDDSQGRLIGWYERHGFDIIHDQGATADMRRKPQPPQSDSQAALDRALAGEPIEWQGNGCAAKP